MIEKLPVMNSLDAQTVLRDQYEARLGICKSEPSGEMNPLYSVLMQPCEDMIAASPLHDRYEEFAAKRYHELWGLSVDEFYNRPKWAVDMLRSISEKVINKRNAAAEGLGRDLTGK